MSGAAARKTHAHPPKPSWVRSNSDHWGGASPEPRQAPTTGYSNFQCLHFRGQSNSRGGGADLGPPCSVTALTVQLEGTRASTLPTWAMTPQGTESLQAQG